MDSMLKSVLKVSPITPSEIIISETGIWDVETQMMQRQLLYYYKITKSGNEYMSVIADEHNPWKKQIEKNRRESRHQPTNVD